MEDIKFYCRQLDCEIEVEADDGVSTEYIRRCSDMIENMSDTLRDEICEAAKRFCLAFLANEKDAVGDGFQPTEPYHRITKDTPARELLALVQLDRMMIGEPADERQLYFRLSGSCDWEIEHGIEADVLDGQLFYLGDYEGVDADSDYYRTGTGRQWNYALTDEQITAPILARLGEIADLRGFGGVSDAEIDEAEQKLRLLFPREYRAVLHKYGSIRFGTHEWAGLGPDAARNVVRMTEAGRVQNANLPAKLFVLENTGTDGNLICANDIGDVFQVRQDGFRQIYRSVLEYLEQCLKE